MEHDRNGLEVLDRHQCLLLLGAGSFGRVGITAGALPVILPINYRLIDEHIVFRTGRGTKLDAAVHRAVVAFEVDAMDPVDHTGWSVAVTGMATEVTDPVLEAAFRAAGLPRWAVDGEDRVVAISTEMVTGRRITAHSRIRSS